MKTAFAFNLRELNGALGDLGTLLPLMLGSIAIGGLAPVPVVLGFAVFYLGTAFYYRLPIPVQPMKAVAAVILTAGMSPLELAIAGATIGVVLLILGLTGWIARLNRLIPQSVLAGLQLGLGALLALTSLSLMAEQAWLGIATLSVLLVTMRFPRWPSVVLALVTAWGLGHFQAASAPLIDTGAPWFPALASWPDMQSVERAMSMLVLPQLSLTVTNAIVLTTLVAGDYFGERAAHVTPARLSVSSGLANLVLTPLGALPMCHGAGGLAAHYRFGARTGTAPLLLGGLLLVVACLPPQWGLGWLAGIPSAGLGALLLVAAWQLAVTKRLFDSNPSCWPVIAVTAVVTLALDPFWGLVAGGIAEGGRISWRRRHHA